MIPLCYTEGRDFVSVGHSITLHQTIPEEVHTLWLNGDVLVNNANIYSLIERTFPNALNVKIFTSMPQKFASHASIELVPKELHTARVIPPVSNTRASVKIDNGIFWDESFSRVCGHVFTNQITFTHQHVTMDMLNNVRAKLYKFHFCTFNFDVSFQSFSNIVFNNCAFDFSAVEKQKKHGTVRFRDCINVDDCVVKRFLLAQNIDLFSCDTVPTIPGFTGNFHMKCVGRTPDLSSPSIRDFSSLRITTDYFEGQAMFPFVHPDMSSVSFVQTDIPRDRSHIMSMMSTLQLYRYFTGQIPLPTAVDLAPRLRVRGRFVETTFDGAQSIHSRGFEKSVDGMYEMLFAEMDPNFAEFDFLHKLGFSHRNTVALVGLNIRKHVKAVVYRASKLSESDVKEWMKGLNDEINLGRGLCSLGMRNRLMNSLVGFFDDIVIEITSTEDLQNQIVLAQRKSMPKAELRKILLERGHSETVVEEWLEYY